MDNTVTIALSDYEELLTLKGRISALEDYLAETYGQVDERTIRAFIGLPQDYDRKPKDGFSVGGYIQKGIDAGNITLTGCEE